MGRVKVPIAKIANVTTRQVTFSKRRSGLIKKAYELSVLCDIEVALIMFSPSGKLSHFSGRRKIEDVLARYLKHPDQEKALPDQDKGDKGNNNGNGNVFIKNKEALLDLLEDLKIKADKVTQPSRCDENNNHLKLLSSVARHCSSSKFNIKVACRQRRVGGEGSTSRVAQVSGETRALASNLKVQFTPEDEFNERERRLLEALRQVVERKNYLLRRSSTLATSAPIPSMQFQHGSLLQASQRMMNVQPQQGASSSMVQQEVIYQQTISKGENSMQSTSDGTLCMKEEEIMDFSFNHFESPEQQYFSDLLYCTNGAPEEIMQQPTEPPAFSSFQSIHNSWEQTWTNTNSNSWAPAFPTVEELAPYQNSFEEGFNSEDIKAHHFN